MSGMVASFALNEDLATFFLDPVADSLQSLDVAVALAINPDLDPGPARSLLSLISPFGDNRLTTG